MKTVGIKFCGGCNPLIERARVAEELKAILPAGFTFENAGSAHPWDIGILICGCPTACADRPEARALAAAWVLVGGAEVDRFSVPVEKIAGTIAAKLEAMAQNEQRRNGL